MSKEIYINYFKHDKKLNLSVNGLIKQNSIYDILKSKDNNTCGIINPFFELIDDIDKVLIILKTNDINPLEYLYLNMKKVHKILLDQDTNINIETKIVQNFIDCYYLYFLISDEMDVINYKYESELIKNVYDLQINAKSTIKKIIISKMILVFIQNFQSID